MQNKTKEAEKVEESLRDFIGRIIGYYEEYGLPNEVLDRYERVISDAETLLEVFDIMKEMFEELMRNLRDKIGISGRKSRTQNDPPEDSCAPGEFEQVLQAYEAELIAHTKTQESTQVLIDRLHEDLKSSKTQIQSLQAKIHELSQPELNIVTENRRFSNQNTRLYSTAVSFGENNPPLSRQLSGYRNRNHEQTNAEESCKKQSARGKSLNSRSPKRISKANSQVKLKPRWAEHTAEELALKPIPYATASLIANTSQGIISNHSRNNSRDHLIHSWAPLNSSTNPPKMSAQFGQLMKQAKSRIIAQSRKKQAIFPPKAPTGLTVKLMGKLGTPSAQNVINLQSSRCTASNPLSLTSSSILRPRPIVFQ